MNMSNADYLIGFVGLAVVGWLAWEWLSRAPVASQQISNWAIQGFVSYDPIREKRWFWFIVVCTILVPAICHAANDISQTYGGISQIRDLIANIPLLGFIVYVSLRSPFPGRGWHFLGAGLVFALSLGVDYLAKLMVCLMYQYSSSNDFMQLVSHVFVAVVLLTIAGRVLSIRLVRATEPLVPRIKLTLLSLLMIQGALAAVILISLWMHNRSERFSEFFPETDYVLLLILSFLIGVVFQVAVFYVRAPQHLGVAVALLLVATLAGALVDFYWTKQIALQYDLGNLGDFGDVQMPKLASFLTPSKLSLLLAQTVVPLLIVRILFRKAGLMVVWGNSVTPPEAAHGTSPPAD